MKMKHLSLAVASAIGAVSIPAQADFNVTNDGVGHILMVPYFSAQSGNDTLINIVNTDVDHGKAVKVRFRSALDSDDIFDFHVYLSPSDMWTGRVSMNPVNGLARMHTSDNSCTRPADVNQDFVVGRLNPAYTTEEKASQTREGYIEILTMADVVDNGVDASSSTAAKETDLFYQIKHDSAGVAPCLATVLSKVGTTSVLFDDLSAPTASLAGNWTIINVPNATAWGGGMTAISTTDLTNIVYFDQNPLQNNLSGLQTVGTVLSDLTADGVLLAPDFGWANYDLPDLSTPYSPAHGTPDEQAADLSNSLLASAIGNEYITVDSVSAETDWVISMPTRRYHVAGRGRISDGVSSDTTGFYSPVGKSGPTGPFTNTQIAAADQVTRYLPSGRNSCVRVGDYAYWDREEQTPSAPPVGDVISPNVPEEAPVVQLCGETTVVGIDQSGYSSSGVLGASVAYTNLPLDEGFDNGWGVLGLNNGFATWGGNLPVIGQAFVSAFNPAATPGTSGNYGGNWQHRFSSPYAY